MSRYAFAVLLQELGTVEAGKIAGSKLLGHEALDRMLSDVERMAAAN